MRLRINEDQLARDALAAKWNELAPVIDRAKEIAQDPQRAEEPDADLYVHWLETFYEELGAIQTVREAAPSLSAEDLRLARNRAEKLLDALRTAEAQRTMASAQAQVVVPPPGPGAVAG